MKRRNFLLTPLAIALAGKSKAVDRISGKWTWATGEKVYFAGSAQVRFFRVWKGINKS